MRAQDTEMEKQMKKFVKRLVSLALAGALLVVPAGAVTQDGESETWFDGVWALIDAFGLKAENDPYILQNYINKFHNLNLFGNSFYHKSILIMKIQCYTKFILRIYWREK